MFDPEELERLGDALAEADARKRIITLTPAAWEAIYWPMVEHCSNSYLRVGVKGGGCSGFEYFMDTIEGKPDDRDLVSEALSDDQSCGIVVAVDPISAQYLRGTTIDYVETGLLSGFKFNNPKATRQCGCGKSFSA